ncbi:MAG: hypothetical protein R3Y50_07980 [Rikenellaceae bacterium]
MNQKGFSYAKRVKEVNDIYDQYVKSGLSNREIWRRYIFPTYGIVEKTFYNYLKASVSPKVVSKTSEINWPTLF